MTLADLLFIVFFLTVVVRTVTGFYQLARGRKEHATRALRQLTVMVVTWLALVVIVSLVSPAQTRPMRSPWCFDDWCFSVDSVSSPERIGSERATKGWRVVSLTVSSRMRRGTQAEPDAYVFLVDGQGKRYEASALGERALDRRNPTRHRIGDTLEPQGSIQVQTAFDVPPDAAPFGLSKARRSRFPSIVIIGDPVSLFHRPTTVLLP